jgi:15-cis-phytoene synthase
LLDLDQAMGDVVIRATEPALAAIKLAWWRERLEELDRGAVPAEPRLQAAAAELLPRGIKGADLAEIEKGWAALLEQQADEARVLARGGRLFRVAAKLLDAQNAELEAAGRLYAWSQVARAGLAGLPAPRKELQALRGRRFSRRVRPVTVLACLAARDATGGAGIEAEATPGRALALLRHRLTGRVPAG